MWNEMSNPAVLVKIGQRIKETRIRQHITQEELATASGVSPLTVANIEKGKSVSLLLFISVLRSLGLLENLEQLVPEIRISPIELKKLQGKKRYRVRHLKQDSHECDLIVDVKLWGESVGSLYWEKESNSALFDYERKFIRSGLDISPIIMPIAQYRNTPYQFLENRTDCFKGLPGLFADSLPDTFGNQIINEWFASRGLSGEEITPLDRLCYVGKRGMGALEFEPYSPINGMNESSVLHIEELTELAKSIFTDRKAFQAQLRQEGRNILDILKVGTSAGGAKPKAIIAYNDITGEVRSGQVKAPEGFGYWLLKFDGGKYSEHTQITDNPRGIGNIEYAYHRMAKACGIDMMECRLLQEKESCHFMTRRFDRVENGEKIHVQTLAGIAHYDRD